MQPIRILIVPLAAAIALSQIAPALAQDKAKPHAPLVATDAAAAGPDFEVQGEYVGEIKGEEESVKVGAQVIALGHGKFRAVGFVGGLPGDGANESTRIETDGQVKDGKVVFANDNGTGTIGLDAKEADGKPHASGVIVVTDANGKALCSLKKVHRASPTLGAKPPAGATVLFDGTSADAFRDGRVKDGLLLEGATSKQKFQSYKIHLEFMLPFMPDARGQGRGNSGYYSQGRYETQILDSFGLVPEKDDCGAIYGIKAPSVNMCYPPLSWQTYDVDYTAAQYEGGKKARNARLTVLFNGVEVQKDTEATHATTAAPFAEGPEASPIYLQDHGNPVRFRNVWIVEKK